MKTWLLVQAGWEEDPAGRGAMAAGKGRLQRECPRDGEGILVWQVLPDEDNAPPSSFSGLCEDLG